FREIKCKGVAAIGAGGVGGPVCLECGGNYTAEEMEMALIIVGCILTVFLIILSCQCYSRIMWECSDHQTIISTTKFMPPPPYNKSHIFV
ncbi:hypothetical protein B4U80_09483, partial [Leptotrombidium deliense]